MANPYYQSFPPPYVSVPSPFYYHNVSPYYSTVTTIQPTSSNPYISYQPEPQNSNLQSETFYQDLETLKQYLIETHELSNKYREELKEQIQKLSDSFKKSQNFLKEKYALKKYSGRLKETKAEPKVEEIDFLQKSVKNRTTSQFSKSPSLTHYSLQIQAMEKITITMATDTPATTKKDGRGKPKTKSISRSTKAGLQFPVGRFARFLKAGRYTQHVSSGSPVYLSAILEHLCAEILELTGNATRDNKKLSDPKRPYKKLQDQQLLPAKSTDVKRPPMKPPDFTMNTRESFDFVFMLSNPEQHHTFIFDPGGKKSFFFSASI
ncbi:uncharacterized protein LOC131599450 [Vicia villosa]|uniref:uncharacterized protein LOC131599450 n=1 Tax=Vicia villosa TaxID=3911 RepID=UPI00273B4DBE|nr:uncharacterized protein LOC131599450 [Vicia villosa]